MIAKKNTADIVNKKLPAVDKRKLWLQLFGFILLDRQSSLKAAWPPHTALSLSSCYSAWAIALATHGVASEAELPGSETGKEKTKQTSSGMNEKQEWRDMTDDFAFLYVKNTLYQIQMHVNASTAATIPAGLSASDLTLCRNSCHQTRQLASEI